MVLQTLVQYGILQISGNVTGDVTGYVTENFPEAFESMIAFIRQ